MVGVTKAHLLTLAVFCIVLLVCVRLYSDHEIYKRDCRDTGENHGLGFPGSNPADVYFEVAQLIKERNNISRMLNLRQQKIGQMECEKIEKEQSKTNVASSGGWCAKTSVENSGEHKTDTNLIPVLADFLKDMHVASFGDGPGRYKQKLLETGKLKGYDAFDGAPFSEKTSNNRVEFLDLTIPQYGLPLYDWVMSLEVAEHIPQEYESIFLDNIVRHAKYGVILSWAVPGQVGYSHINNRSPEYVKKVFADRGFEHDPVASQKLKDAASLTWLQTNTNVYRRKDTSTIEHIKTFFT